MQSLGIIRANVVRGVRDGSPDNEAVSKIQLTKAEVVFSRISHYLNIFPPKPPRYAFRHELAENSATHLGTWARIKFNNQWAISSGVTQERFSIPILLAGTSTVWSNQGITHGMGTIFAYRLDHWVSHCIRSITTSTLFAYSRSASQYMCTQQYYTVFSAVLSLLTILLHVIASHGVRMNILVCHACTSYLPVSTQHGIWVKPTSVASTTIYNNAAPHSDATITTARWYELRQSSAAVLDMMHGTRQTFSTFACFQWFW